MQGRLLFLGEAGKEYNKGQHTGCQPLPHKFSGVQEFRSEDDSFGYECHSHYPFNLIVNRSTLSCPRKS